ncbi:MAG: putative peptidoglycan glycosyltransferase FtsW [Planctomycetota bacterium]|nr:putative peptidoglycan glycosyltransferase FtsW [Planctomycetota bacterium]
MVAASLPQPNDVRHAARVVLGTALGLVALGLVMVYSTSSALHAVDGSGHTDMLLRQLRWVVLGVLAATAAAFAPPAWLRRAAVPAMVVAILLLALTLILGPAVKGSRRWLYVAGFSLQASELLKIAVLLYLADRLARRDEAAEAGRSGRLLPILAPVGIGLLLVLVAPDLGTALFIAAQAVVLLAFAGVRPTRVLPLALTVIPAVGLFAYTRFPHVRNRLQIYSSGADEGSQLHEALVAIGSGGALGKGLGQGAQKLGYFAEAHNDFIFAVIGEELGFLGCAAVVCAYMAMAWYGRRIAWAARRLDSHALYLAAGATFIVTFQALINIAVVTATAPTKGVSLPFVSTGGSNLLMASVCIGLLLGVARRAAIGAGPSR